MQAQSHRLVFCRRFSLASPSIFAAIAVPIAALSLHLPTVRAQAKPAAAQGQALASSAAPARAAGTTAPGPAQAVNTAARRSGGGGMHEGINVHGHWVIEVKKPDGKLVSHTEFENSLSANGNELLGSFLAQNTPLTANSLLISYTPGEWGILLGDPNSSPCSANLAAPFNNPHAVGPIGQSGYSGPYCVIAQQAPPAAIYPTGCGSGGSGCSYNLSLGWNTTIGGISLTGSVLAQTAGTISQVQTQISTCGSNVAPSVCWSETSADSPESNSLNTFTAATLPQQGSGQCGGTNQPECAVPVAAGQTIQVSVVLSFQ